ncbi:MAG: HopJ type III effector protein [Gallionella sp.]|nr:HopJ type III effector protein [Gallionella sp.]
MELNEFLQRLNDAPDSICFNDTIALIDALYDFTPTAFANGTMRNEAGQNNGSCKLFSFAKLNGLSQQQTLTCFGDYYRKDVLGNPEGTDHQNIRNFIKSGWDGVRFEGKALTKKSD